MNIAGMTSLLGLMLILITNTTAISSSMVMIFGTTFAIAMIYILYGVFTLGIIMLLAATFQTH
jgi:hypothetical protein